MVASITALVAVWAVVMLQRNEIRARWWEYKLLHSDALEDRAHYLALLASLGPRAVSVAGRLLEHADAVVRSYSLVILDQVSGEQAERLLRRAAVDRDPDVREGAIRGLGLRRDVPGLADILAHSDPLAAGVAVEALGSIGSSEAIDLLIARGLVHESVAVRVQTIEVLGELEADAAVDALMACLDDSAALEGMTAAQRSAARALEALHPGVPVDWPGPRTVADFAREALRRITGESPGTTDGDSPGP